MKLRTTLEKINGLIESIRVMQNLRYRRNSIRHQVMPILKQFNPNLVDVLSRQANIVREESEYLDGITLAALESAVQKSDDQRIVLSRKILAEIPPPIQRRVILLLYRRVSNRDVHPRFDFVENVLDHVKQGTLAGNWRLLVFGYIKTMMRFTSVLLGKKRILCSTLSIYRFRDRFTGL